MKKIQEFLRKVEARKIVMLSLALTVMCMSCFAADGNAAATITTSFTTGFSQIVSDSTSMIAAIVPIALSLAGVIFLVKKAMSWFKSMAK